MSLETLERQHQVWARKPALRRIYHRYFERVLAQCTAERPTVELGSGSGFFKQHRPDIIATDVFLSPWIDCILDASGLPFADGALANLVLVDVFHHFAAPQRFLAEAARVLRSGGRIVMLEPWTGPLGFLFYRHIHQEKADRDIDPHDPIPGDKRPFDGNPALPELYFKSRGGKPAIDLPSGLRLVSMREIPGFDWLLTGGFQDLVPLPGPLTRLADAVESVASTARRILALRALIVVERR